MARAVPSVDELVRTLSRSLLPTVLVEGESDILVYRTFEKQLGSHHANFLPVGGRENLLAIYNRRQEFSQIPTCFVADQDMWLFEGQPHQFKDVVLTSGYSIENDVYHDSGIEGVVLHADEKENHRIILNELARWFAFQVEEFQQNRAYLADPHLSQLIPIPGFTCSPAELLKQGFREPAKELFQDIRDHYKLKLRGKLLYEVLVRFSHAKKRRPRYGYDQLREISVGYSVTGKLINILLDSISGRLGIVRPPVQLDMAAVQNQTGP